MGHLSEPYHSAWYPEVFRVTGHQPTWSSGYLVQFTGNATGKINVEAYDKQGRLVTKSRMSFPDATRIFLFDAAPRESGGVVASGHATTNEGGTGFLAKTDVSGNVVSVLRTGMFTAGRVCEASDGTVWVNGGDTEKEAAHDDDFPLVRQYSFEEGLLHSYLSRKLVALRSGSARGGGPVGSFLVCGKDRISLYLNQTNEFVEIDPSTQSLQRWKVDMSPLATAYVTGLALTEKGRVFASLFEFGTERKTHGLFELRKEPGASTAGWIAVGGTVNSYHEGEILPKGTFWRLWGSDGDDLIVGLQYDADLSWVRVLR